MRINEKHVRKFQKDQNLIIKQRKESKAQKKNHSLKDKNKKQISPTKSPMACIMCWPNGVVINHLGATLTAPRCLNNHGPCP